jgi:hypothetical protein
MLFPLLDAATAVQSICLLGGQGNAGTRPERRCKSGMDGGLTAASLVSSPPLYLRTAVFLSNQPGPPQFTHPEIERWIAQVLLFSQMNARYPQRLAALRDSCLPIYIEMFDVGKRLLVGTLIVGSFDSAVN